VLELEAAAIVGDRLLRERGVRADRGDDRAGDALLGLAIVDRASMIETVSVRCFG
jgi:hypothetical protein